MKNRICKLVSFVLCLTLLLGLCLPAQAALTAKGKTEFMSCIGFFDIMFEEAKYLADGKVSVMVLTSEFDLPEGVIFFPWKRML